MRELLALGAMFWAGLVVGVSFLATPVKFRAESLSLPVALDVGRQTFHLMGRVEIALAVGMVAVAVLLAIRQGVGVWVGAAIGLVIIIVIAQALVLLPRLDARTSAIIDGEVLASSRLHLVYVASEIIKLATLASLAIRLSLS